MLDFLRRSLNNINLIKYKNINTCKTNGKTIFIIGSSGDFAFSNKSNIQVRKSCRSSKPSWNILKIFRLTWTR